MAKKRFIAAGLLSALALVAVAGCVPADMYGDYPYFGYQQPVVYNWYTPPPVYYNNVRPYRPYYWNRYHRTHGYRYAPRRLPRYGNRYPRRRAFRAYGARRYYNNRTYRRSGGPRMTRRWGGNPGPGGPGFTRGGGGHQPRNFHQGGGGGGHQGSGGGSSGRRRRHHQ